MTLASVIDRVRDTAILSHGWRRALLSLASGAASVLALPPFGLFPLLALTFGILVWLLDSISERQGWKALGRAFLIGWFFGFGYFLAGLWWVGAAFLVESDVFGWLLPLAVAGLPAGLAIFTGFGTAFSYLLWSRGPARAFALTVGLGLSEYARANLFTGFPWNTFGYALTVNEAQMQAASLIGVDGLTLVAIFLAAAPAIWLTRDGRQERLRMIVGASAVAILFAQFVFGELRLLNAETVLQPGIRLRLVQPNLTQAERLDRSRHLDVLERYLRLSRPAPGEAPPTHVIWPESALPFRIDDSPLALTRITGVLAPGSVLILGRLRADELDPGHVLNSLYVLDDQANVLDRYDKTHLVPFGEYLPFGDFLASIGLEPLTRIFAFVPGHEHGPVLAGAAPPFTALICYEAIFGPEVGRAGRAGWIVNISDDSWFGDTLGPRQHFHQARLRAVEQGLPLARVTTTGRSALIDPYGRIMKNLDIGSEGAINIGLPKSLPPTLYMKMRNYSFWCLWAISAILVLTARISLIVERNNF